MIANRKRITLILKVTALTKGRMERDKLTKERKRKLQWWKNGLNAPLAGNERAEARITLISKSDNIYNAWMKCDYGRREWWLPRTLYSPAGEERYRGGGGCHVLLQLTYLEEEEQDISCRRSIRRRKRKRRGEAVAEWSACPRTRVRIPPTHTDNIQPLGSGGGLPTGCPDLPPILTLATSIKWRTDGQQLPSKSHTPRQH